MKIQRWNGKNGIPEMELSEFGHWVTFESYSLALLDANKSAERKWEASCSSEDKIRAEYEEQLSKQQTIIVGLSSALFLIVGVFILNWI